MYREETQSEAPLGADESVEPSNRRDPRQGQPNLHYLNILQDAVKDVTASPQAATSSVVDPQPSPEEDSITQIRLMDKPTQLDDIDNEFLLKKGVFELPSSFCM